MRAAIFGDIGGHSAPFFKALESLGVNLSTGEVPKDLTIIQLGDLIHKGPGSEELVELADRAINRNADQWCQLLGNHEMQHLGGYEFWRCNCSPKLVSTLQSWWANGAATTVAGISHAPVEKLLKNVPTLLSHAGVTHLLWRNVQSDDFLEAGKVLLEREKNSFAELNRAGYMLGGATSIRAGVIWAHSTLEVYPSWFDESMPFNQIHGHTAPFSWERNEWYPGTSKAWRKALKCSPSHRATYFTPSLESLGNFVALDPGFEMGVPRVDSVPFLMVEDFKRIF